MSAPLGNSQTTDPHKQMHYWMSQEFSKLHLLLLAVAFCMIFYGISVFTLYNKASRIFIFLGLMLFLFTLVLLPRLLCTKFMVKHSAIGRQLRVFGDFDTIYPEILAAVESPLYTNGTELVSKKYIFLMPEPAQSPQISSFQNKGKLFILPVRWLSRVSIKPNEPYPDEMNTILFRLQHRPANISASNGLYTMTIHMDASATKELVTAITAHMNAVNGNGQDVDFLGPLASFSEKTGDFTAKSAFFTEKIGEPTAFSPKQITNAPPSGRRRSPAARSAARFRSNPLRELRDGKMRVFRLVVLLILFANVGTILWIYFMLDGSLSTLPRDFVRFIHRELLSNPQNLLFALGLLAIYLIPTLFVYVMIRRWYRGFLEEYEKLPQTEQQELLKQLCDNFETGQPAVIYTGRCFCFRDMRRLSFQTLLPYSSVLWIYRTHGAFPIGGPAPGLETQIDFCHLVIRTDHRKKYRIASGDEPKLYKRMPDAIKGYGDIQRETYLNKLRSLK